MHALEPYYNWRHLYAAEEDENSPFFEKEYSEFEFTNAIYNYLIHPQWDEFGSTTLYLKILFVDYERGYTIIEFIGEWNDAVTNDIMTLKREIIDLMISQGVNKFVLIMENVLNFFADDDSYYEEWQEDIADDGGWIVMLNAGHHLMQEFEIGNIQKYVFFKEYDNWRTHKPNHVFEKIDNELLRLL